MRSYRLAAKIAAFFLLVMGTYLVMTMVLFGRIVMHPVLHRTQSIGDAHHAFVVAVLEVGIVAAVLMAAFAVYVTAPLRRMSRSMGRIAAGDLEHRVPVRGRDEVAVMGRSFNAMAERVRGMVVGQKELMAGVSHELRSPLARMKLSLELLREGKGGAGRISDLEAEVDALNALVEELLLASRLDLGSVPLKPEMLDLVDLCQEAWNRVAAEAEAQSMTLAVHCADYAQQVRADRSLVVRLLGNLFENSVRYAGTGEVTVSSESRGDRLLVAVTDDDPESTKLTSSGSSSPFFEPTGPVRARPERTAWA